MARIKLPRRQKTHHRAVCGFTENHQHWVPAHEHNSGSLISNHLVMKSCKHSLNTAWVYDELPSGTTSTEAQRCHAHQHLAITILLVQGNILTAIFFFFSCEAVKTPTETERTLPWETSGIITHCLNWVKLLITGVCRAEFPLESSGIALHWRGILKGRRQAGSWCTPSDGKLLETENRPNVKAVF